MSDTQKPLAGKVAVVAGATRGAGRGIAHELGMLGATVYCTGRSTRDHKSAYNRPEIIEETAEIVTAAGGHGIAVQVDHMVPEQVQALFERVDREQNGRLDILVNDVWGGEGCFQWDVPFWELDTAQGIAMIRNATETHMWTSRYGAPLMVKRNSGLILEIGDGMGYQYRGSFFYSLSKILIVHMAAGMAADLKEHKADGVTALALTPGYLRSELMLDHWGITEEEWQEGMRQDPVNYRYTGTESPRYIGRAVAALATDPKIAERNGQSLSSWNLMREYGFTDYDGRQPFWGGQ